ncbi:MAG TPA: S1 RNA-binding domain-containing protein, partial [Tepidisphaeraceae bacterium]|nr:S1 RNA-binding domain-containing protein [Tepidisphaeraceae bacterium]
SERDLIDVGRHTSYSERRSEDAENELRKVKLLTLLQGHVGEEYTGVVTGITNFGLFVQLQRWLIDGLIRYEDLMDDWWDVDERAGVVRGQRTGKKIGIGDVVRVIIAAVDVPRRELDLTIIEVMKKAGHPDPKVGVQPKRSGKKKPPSKKHEHRGGASRRNMKSKRRGKGK